MHAFSALCTGAAAGAVGTYHMYHAVWKSRDHVAESSSLYVQQHDPTGRQVRRRGSACACTRKGLASSRASCNPERAHAPRAPSSARLPCPPRAALSCPRSGCTTRSRKSSRSGGTRLSSACTACSQTCSRARQSEPLAGRSARSMSYAVRLHQQRRAEVGLRAQLSREADHYCGIWHLRVSPCMYPIITAAVQLAVSGGGVCSILGGSTRARLSARRPANRRGRPC